MDKNLADAELKIVTYLDAHTRIARTAAWVVAAVNAVLIITGILAADLLRAGISAVTALVIVWLLVKTRSGVVVTPAP